MLRENVEALIFQGGAQDAIAGDSAERRMPQ